MNDAQHGMSRRRVLGTLAGAAGAVAVGVGSPLLGDAVRGGDLAALRERAAAFLAGAAA